MFEALVILGLNIVYGLPGVVTLVLSISPHTRQLARNLLTCLCWLGLIWLMVVAYLILQDESGIITGLPGMLSAITIVLVALVFLIRLKTGPPPCR